MAEKNKPMKSNLFRFVTLRNPQLIEEKDKEKGFIYHPSISKSAYNNVIKATEKDKKNAIKEIIFKALKTRQDVKKIDANLYTFSSWLMRNKNTFSYLSIKDNIKGATVLTNANELLIWDNLIYQTLHKESVYVREALIQMLIVNKFLSAFNKMTAKFTVTSKLTEAQKTELIRRAKAAVVISKDLFVNTSSTTNKKHAFSESEIKSIHKKMEAEFAGLRFEKYETLLSELKKEERIYTKNTAKAYDVALEAHNTQVKSIIEKTEPVLIDETDSKTGKITQVKTYPNLTLPKFSFQKEDPLNNKYLSGRISEESLEILDALDYNTYNNLPEVIQSVEEEIKDDTQILIGANDNNTPINVNVGGTTVAIDNSVHSLAPYCFIGSRHKLANNKSAIYMYLGTGYANASITNATYTLTNEATNTQITGTQVQQFGSNATSIKEIFFPQGLPTLLNGNYTFSGEITLDNNVVLTFNVSNIKISHKGFSFNSCCTIKSGDVTVDPDPIIIDNAPLYGVTKLGIADFRRVEQEVCCYVPGEVSHIENILAREYKERSTRTLTSMETTTEETKESEVENLSDTTTTERNEMQSEASSIVNEDQSLNVGANASVNGTFPSGGYSVGAFANYSSSSATSNSNTQAQTYAQEVTERAMERIVQKTTKKRTSRILREFEENNKHGFDNTKGDKHISGVYRWVDKVYKNTLLNYGKRLMYEFAIPEPAKFFKQAIKEKANKGTLDSNIILPEKPIHPKDFIINLSNNTKLKNAKKLDKYNYQEIVSYYNVEVSPYVEEEIILGKSFAEKLKETTGDSLKFEIENPEGYYMHSYKFSYNNIPPHNGRYNHSKIIVGSAKTYFTWNEGLTQDVFKLIPDQYTKSSLPITLIGWDVNIIQLNVTVKCKREDYVLEQWQNQVYKAIMDAYQDRVNEYNASLAFTKQNEGKISFNPLTNRSIEKKELKRLAIDLLAAPKSYNISRDNYELNSKTTIGKNSEFQNHATIVKFFEQAFEWDIMAYTYYPYFYADEGIKNKNWIDLFQSTDAADPIFQAFLQSGMARTVVSVRPGFEDAVNWYMTTGEIWNGQGLVTDQEDDLYVSIAEEMQTIEGTVEGTWETKLPTSLTVLQAGTIGLDLQGLPCDTECDDWALFDSDNNPVLDEKGDPKTNNPLKQTNQLIGGDKGIGDSTTTV